MKKVETKKLLAKIVYFSLISFFIVCLSYLFSWLRDQREKYLLGENTIYKQDAVLGVSTETYTLDANYTKVIRKNSSLLFGGSNPRAITEDTWDKLQENGITAVRVPFFIEHVVPKNSSISSYKKNINNIQDSSTWNKEIMSERTNLLIQAKKRGMKTIGIIDYSPSWLNYNKQAHGVPQDWEVYMDIVEEVYSKNRDYLDYIEIWNEPDYLAFLNTKGTEYNPITAYISIFLNTSTVIKNYDKQVNDGKYAQIGGPALSKLENTNFLSSILENKELRESMDFLSVHNYDQHSDLDTSEIRKIMTKYGINDIPLFLTEWNYSPDETNSSPQMISEEGIPYVADRFIDMINQNITANFFYALQPIDTKNKGYGHGYLAFFENFNNEAVFLPKAKTWTLFSKTLGLSQETFDVVESTSLQEIKSISVINSKGENILSISNNSSEKKTVFVNAVVNENNENYSVVAYVAEGESDPNISSGSIRVKSENGVLKYKLIIPSKSVVGVTMKQSRGFIL